MFKTKIKVGYNQAVQHIIQKRSYKNSTHYCKPTDINLIVTSRCNLKCKYCNYWKIKPNKELTIEKWKSIVLNLKKWLGPYHLTISGGEPLLFKDLFELIEFATKNDALVTLITNGTLFDKDVAKKISKAKLYNLIVSLDGFKETNDLIRGRGSYDKAILGIDILKRLNKNMKLSLAMVISKRNLNELTSMVEFTKNRGLDFIYFQPLNYNSKSPYDKDWHMKNEFFPKDTEKIDSVIDELVIMKRKNYSIANPATQLKLMKNYFKNPAFSKNKCFVGVKNCNIDASGNITNCFNMKPIGNVLESNIEELWHSKKADETRKKIKNCKIGCSILNCNYTKSPLDRLGRLF